MTMPLLTGSAARPSYACLDVGVGAGGAGGERLRRRTEDKGRCSPALHRRASAWAMSGAVGGGATDFNSDRVAQRESRDPVRAARSLRSEQTQCRG